MAEATPPGTVPGFRLPTPETNVWVWKARAKAADAEAKRLRALIDKILDYSAYTAGQQAAWRREAGLDGTSDA